MSTFTLPASCLPFEKKSRAGSLSWVHSGDSHSYEWQLTKVPLIYVSLCHLVVLQYCTHLTLGCPKAIADGYIATINLTALVAEAQHWTCELIVVSMNSQSGHYDTLDALDAMRCYEAVMPCPNISQSFAFLKLDEHPKHWAIFLPPHSKRNSTIKATWWHSKRKLFHEMGLQAKKQSKSAKSKDACIIISLGHQQLKLLHFQASVFIFWYTGRSLNSSFQQTFEKSSTLG